MRFFLDCEWNDYKGELISMALVDDLDKTWYEVLELPPMLSDWAQENIVPVLRLEETTSKAYLSLVQMQSSLEQFLALYETITIVADWPEDIAHFCTLTIKGPGERIKLPKLTFEFKSDCDTTESVLLHNALADAIALRNNWLSKSIEKVKSTKQLTPELIRKLRGDPLTGPAVWDDQTSIDNFYTKIGWLGCAFSIINGED